MNPPNLRSAEHAATAPRGRRRPRPYLVRAYGLKRSCTWLTNAGLAAAEERLNGLPDFFARYDAEEFGRIRDCEYDGPWLRGSGAPTRRDPRIEKEAES